MSALSRACAARAEAMPAPSPRPRNRGRVATPAISLTSVPSRSTGWWEPTATGSPFSTATISTVRPVAMRSRSTAVRVPASGSPAARAGAPPARVPADDCRRGVAERDHGDLLVARQLGIVGPDDVEPDAGRAGPGRPDRRPRAAVVPRSPGPRPAPRLRCRASARGSTPAQEAARRSTAAATAVRTSSALTRLRPRRAGAPGRASPGSPSGTSRAPTVSIRASGSGAAAK